MPNHKSTLRLLSLLFVSLLGANFAMGYEASYYAQNSALASGKWAKIEVSETGMQYISDNVLKNLGFSDPEKVNVYGYGGVMIPETLESPDDLPMVASIRVNGGIIFFGQANVGWRDNTNGSSKYSHISHPYSDKAFYFVSDVVAERKTPGEWKAPSASGEAITVFTERLLHEQELSMPITTGRLVLGEDFRSNSSQTFKFQLPGNTGDAVVSIAFGCKTSSGTSSLVISANGKQLPASASDQLPSSDTKLIVTTNTVKEVANPGTSLDISIKFNGGGSVSKAGLDYIEVEYPRSLSLSGGELYFYLSPSDASEVKLEGGSPSTIVWDVTDPVNPKQVDASLNGSTITFATPPGYHEYMAFEPSRVSRAVAPASTVANQDIHSMPAPGMLVISPSEYLAAADRLINIHQRYDGLELLVLTPEDIYNEFSCGKPDVSAFRKLLKMWYDRAEGVEGEFPAYCVILSRPTYDNKGVTAVVKSAGYPRVPIWQSATGETATTSYSTDDYIGMLEDVSGNFNIGTAKINVAVGRMPFKSMTDANSALDKLEAYLFEPDYGAWRNNLMVIADDQDNGVHMEQAEAVIDAMASQDKGANMLYEKLYLDSFPLEYTGIGASYPQAHERMMNKWNEGLAYIDYIGHANPSSWGHEHLLTWTDINSMSNKRLPIIYAATCEFMRWDEDETSGAEILWLLPNSGAIGLICPSREVLISANGVLNRSVAQQLFESDATGRFISIGDVMVRGKNSSNTGTNKLRYGLIGDPSMRMPWPNYNVKVDNINGIDLSSGEFPVVSARSNVTVAGHLEDNDGVLLQDFNGVVEIALYDAEKVVTTNGNGSDGVEMEYNDRKTRLFVGRVKVKEGKWTTKFMMPSEIENNYSPALLSLYAFDDRGREANGACEQLYAYGYDDKTPEDFEGPKIIEFYIDNPNFENGSHVSPNPTITAKFYDESGISVSEAGIGHSILLSLDGKTFYDDVSQYYLPDDTDSGAGSITYNLGNVAQGSHTLSLTVWDNANNSTTASIDFSISALWKPSIQTLTTDVNPASSSVNFIIATDGATSSMDCEVEVYDIWGRRVWRDKAPSLSSASTRTTLGWNLCDFSGARIPGGVYLYRATVKTDAGATVTKTRKLMVKGQ